VGIQGKTYSYEYDVNGLRTRKTNSDGGYTEYYTMDGLTVAERRFDLNGDEVYVMRYYFDESNAPVGIGIQYPSYGDTYWENYYFAKNAQGDIIAIYNSNNGNPESGSDGGRLGDTSVQNPASLIK
jgi:hypothetical protein